MLLLLNNLKSDLQSDPFSQEQRRQAEQAALSELLKNASEEERAKILSNYKNQERELQSRLNDEKEASRDKVKAKIAARKRMREQLGKDDAVSEELERITRKHVSDLTVRKIAN